MNPSCGSICEIMCFKFCINGVGRSLDSIIGIDYPTLETSIRKVPSDLTFILLEITLPT